MQTKTNNSNGLLRTKLHTFYQRIKKRNLFDIYYPRLYMIQNRNIIITSFNIRIEFSMEKALLQKEFLLNKEEKEQDLKFTADMEVLLIAFTCDKQASFARLKPMNLFSI